MGIKGVVVTVLLQQVCFGLVSGEFVVFCFLERCLLVLFVICMAVHIGYGVLRV